MHRDIVLTKDVFLDQVLTIPAGAHVTLKSVTGNCFFRLVGLDGQCYYC